MQLVYGLEAIGFNEEGFHSLELSYCIAELMGFKGEDFIDGFNWLYWDNLEKCRELELANSRENLRPLAKECYQELKGFKQYRSTFEKEEDDR